MATWDQPAVTGSGAVCFTCGCGSHDTLAMERLLGVGFGDVQVTKDGEHVWSESSANPAEWGDIWTAADAEKAAADEPEHDWRIRFIAPMYGAEYQRQGAEHWVLISKDEGFA